ncbi:MAG: hypothetical protein ACLQVY_09120 [Limisphaerales bacterium]
MKKKNLNSIAARWLFCLASLAGFQSSLVAQCTLTFPSGNAGVVTFDVYPSGQAAFTTFATTPTTALFSDIIVAGNPTIPTGSGPYLGWCIDVLDQIDTGSGGQAVNQTWPVLMYSTCSGASTLEGDLQSLGYPPTTLNPTQQQWNEVNYILNHKTGSPEDVQYAIWEVLGENPASAGWPPAPTTGEDGTAISTMVSGANGDQSFVPTTGQTVAVVLAVPYGKDLDPEPGTPEPTAITQLTILEVPVPQPQMVCCPPPQQKCGGWGGSVWCNAQLSCNPGKPCTVSCQNACVTFNCSSGHSYTYNVPNCQVNFSSKCSYSSCSYQNGQWCTTVPCSGDSQVFLTGCGIPWQSDFNNCTSICWTGNFKCNIPGVSCQWQTGACSYNCDLSNCNTVQVKPCYQNYCGYNNNDCAGTPENYKSYCSGGNNWNNGWNNNGWNNSGWNNSYCGNWSNPGCFKW